MKKAAIVLDDWKLAVFKRILDEEGYCYTQTAGPFTGSVTLTVETDSIAKLTPVVERMNAEARAGKMN